MAQSPQVKAFLHPDTSTFSHVVWDAGSRRAAVIDSVLHYEATSGRTSVHYADQIIRFIRENDLETEWVLETHAHADHVTAGAYIKRTLSGTSGIGAGIRDVQKHFRAVYNLERGFLPDGSQFDHLFEDGETFRVGNIEARAIATPGHTPDHLTYLIGDAAFVGDSLFMPDSGTARCDFPGGSAETLYRSIQRLFELHEATRLFVLHDYGPGGRERRNETTVGAEKRDNIHVGGARTKDEFIKLRTERDKTLGLPALIVPAVQINICAGELPPAEANAMRYIKIPIDEAQAFSATIGKEPPTP
ncbi:MAG: MBL fold metallo-hydrolase [Gammaproteobacteria bacterium]